MYNFEVITEAFDTVKQLDKGVETLIGNTVTWSDYRRTITAVERFENAEGSPIDIHVTYDLVTHNKPEDVTILFIIDAEGTIRKRHPINPHVHDPRQIIDYITKEVE